MKMVTVISGSQNPIKLAFIGACVVLALEASAASAAPAPSAFSRALVASGASSMVAPTIQPRTAHRCFNSCWRYGKRVTCRCF